MSTGSQAPSQGQTDQHAEEQKAKALAAAIRECCGGSLPHDHDHPAKMAAAPGGKAAFNPKPLLDLIPQFGPAFIQALINALTS